MKNPTNRHTDILTKVELGDEIGMLLEHIERVEKYFEAAGMDHERHQLAEARRIIDHNICPF